MAEPNLTAGATAVALGTVTITGTVLGMHYDALVFGFCAALVALMHMPSSGDGIRAPVRVFSMLAGAAFCAGVFAPLASAALVEYLPWAASIGVDLLRVVSAAIIGATANVALPLIFGWMARRAGSMS